MTVTVNHAKTNAISDWTQAQLDEQIALGNFPAGTTLADIVLPSDWNDDHTLTGLGTMAEQNANSVAITGGSVNGTTIGATTASTGRFTSVTTPSVTATTNDLTLSAISTGNVNLNTAGGTGLRVSDVASSVRYVTFNGATSSGSPGFFASAGSLAQSSGATSNINFYTNLFAQEQMRVSHTASAVNYVQVTGSSTGGFPVISAQGSDSVTGLNLYAKGAARINFFNNNGSNRHVSIGGNGTAAVNFIDLNGTTATNAPVFSVAGSDTNISMAFQPKGTGAIDLAAGSSGVNISNGGTVTAITRTAAGSGYTSVPSVAITAPTTAGGVQATATAQVVINGVTSIASGGTGYTVGDVLTVSGGTAPSQTTQLTVATVSSGVITSVTITRFGTYTVTPSNPASVTGGTGSSATFNLNYAVQSGTFTITNAGSGYIEQPTITFSGGGGSGAAAYATVGSATVIKTLGSVANSSGFSFQTPAGEQLRISDAGNTSVNYLAMWGNATGAAPRFVARGSDTDVSLLYSTKGAGTHIFRTNDTNQTQFQVSHTASAVNYVQVTGGATGSPVIISAQGSDASVPIRIRSKGTFNIQFENSSLQQGLIVSPTGSANYLQVTSSNANVAPILASAGSDTNIDLALTPKGTGLVRFGTYVAGALLATGYINIKAADGTTYKVLVST